MLSIFTTPYISNLPVEKWREKYTAWLSHSKRRFRPTRRSLPFFSRFHKMTYRLRSLIGYSRCVILPVLSASPAIHFRKCESVRRKIIVPLGIYQRMFVRKQRIGRAERPIRPRQRGFVAWEISRCKSRLGFFGITTGETDSQHCWENLRIISHARWVKSRIHSDDLPILYATYQKSFNLVIAEPLVIRKRSKRILTNFFEWI